MKSYIIIIIIMYNTIKYVAEWQPNSIASGEAITETKD